MSRTSRIRTRPSGSRGSLLDRIERIHGVTWVWDASAAKVGEVPGSRGAGVIAQDVERVFPDLVAHGPDGYRRVSYSGLIGVLVECVKELHKQTRALEARLATLEGPPTSSRRSSSPRARLGRR